MREARQGRHSVHGGVKDQLRPLCGPRIAQRFRLESTSKQQLSSLLYYFEWGIARLKGSEPGRRVEFVLDMGIAVPGSAHECRAADNLPPCVLRDDFLAPQAILRGYDDSSIKPFTGHRDRFFHLRRFRGDNPEITIRQFQRINGRAQSYREVMRSGNPEPIAIQSFRMVRSPYQGPHFRFARQVCGVQAADRAAPDDADSLHVPAAGAPLHLDQISRPTNLSLERSEQAVCVVKGIFDKDSLFE